MTYSSTLYQTLSQVSVLDSGSGMESFEVHTFQIAVLQKLLPGPKVNYIFDGWYSMFDSLGIV